MCTNGLQTWSSLEEPVQDHPYVRDVGDLCGSPKASELRVFSLNAAVFPHKADHPKNTRIRKWINSVSADVLILQELDVAWHMVSSGNRLETRLKEWFPQSRSICAWYAKYPALKSPRQYGGTAIIVLNHTVSRVLETKVDRLGLGRWCWVRLQGRDRTHVTIVSAYRPVENVDGDQTVYNQQAYYFGTVEQDYEVCPRERFNQDLLEQLKLLRQQGDEIILGIDYNGDTKALEYQNLLTKVHMQDCLEARHESISLPASVRTGSKKIDSLAASVTLQPIRSGSLDFVEGVSDHRPSFAIFKTMDVFGQPKPGSVPFNARRLNCDDPRTVNKYVKLYDSWLRKHGLYSRAVELENSIREGKELQSHQIKEFEYIDRARIAGMKWAEKKCRTLFAGGLVWSKQLQNAMDHHRFWELVLQRWDGHDISARRILRLAESLTIVEEEPTTRLEIVDRLKAAKKTYDKKKKAHKSLRATHYEDLAAAKIEAGQEKEATALSNLRHREKIRHDNRVIKHVMGKNIRRAVSSVKTTNIHGVEVVCNTQQDIESAGLQEFEERLRQSSERPLQQRLSIDLLGPEGLSEIADEVLRTGKVPQELKDLDPFLEDYLAAHARGVTQLLTDELTTAAHSQGWKKPKERTSSGRSGIHFGHFKAGSTQANIAAFEAIMSSIPWRSGYSPQRWRNSNDVMIEKKPGDYHVTRLRTIMLFEADFNQGNKILGRNLMKNAEMFGYLAPEQYGSRRFFTAINQGLNKRLTFDLLRQRKQRGALASTDAKSCYDCISHISASLAMRRVGASKSAVKCMLSTLQEVRHYIKSAFGESITYFDSNDGSGIPIHGVGQGNGAAPAIWALVSTPIFDALRRRGYGVFLTAPLTGEPIHFVGYAFVDDTDLAVTDRSILYEEGSTQLFDLMQESVNLWEGFIRCSGGAIRPDKSHWFLIDFEWEEGKWKYSNNHQHELTVRNPDGVVEKIEQIPIDTGIRTVGVRLAPDGNNWDEFQYLQGVAEEWIGKIQTTRLPREMVWTSFSTGVMKTLTFPLAATTFTKQDCEALQTPLLMAAIPSIGVNRYFPRALLHGPKRLQGLEIPHLYIEQGVTQIRVLMDCHGRQGNITSQLTQTSLEQAALEIGLNQSIFHVRHSTWRSLLTGCWMASLWDFCEEYNLILRTPVTSIPLLRANDKNFMVQVGKLSLPLQQVEATNRCRLYLGIQRFSDLLDVGGHAIRRSIWNRDICRRRNISIEWPRQGQPSKSDWMHWEDVLIQLFHLQLPQLTTSTWLGPITSLKDWEWFKSGDRVMRVDWQAAEVEVYSIVTATRRAVTLSSCQGCIQLGGLPSRITPVDVEALSQEKYVTSVHESSYHVWEELLQDLPATTLEQAQIRRIRHDCQWLCQFQFESLSDDAILQLRKCLCTTGWAAVSDGSSKDGTGSAAWIIQGEGVTVGGGFAVPGQDDDQDSYRSEAFGLVAILTLLRSVVKHFSLHTAIATIACDGKSALDRIFANDRPVKFNEAHWDVIDAAQAQLCKLPYKQIFHRHVKGHQDEKSDRELDYWEKLNVLMDSRAKWCREQDKPPPTIPHLQMQWGVELEGDRVVRMAMPKLRFHCTAPAAIQYWKEKDQYNGEEFAIGWEALEQAMKEVPRNRAQWVTKAVSGWQATNKNMVKWGKASSDKCVRCGKVDTADHFLFCGHKEANKMWEKKCRELEEWLKKNKTQPKIREMILSRLRSTRAGTRPYRFPRSKFYGTRQALVAQDDIGWEKVFYGRLAMEWSHAQHRYYEFIKSRRSGKRWLISLIKKIWDISWDMWDDRNKVNVERRLKLERTELEQKVREEFELGWMDLSFKNKKLFTKFSVEDRVKQSTQTLHSWLLRVIMARDESHQRSSVSNYESIASSNKRKQDEIKEKRERNNNKMRKRMRTWLQRDHGS